MRSTMRRGVKRGAKSTGGFFSMKENPKGMSVGNFVGNVKRTAASVKNVVKRMPPKRKSR